VYCTVKNLLMNIASGTSTTKSTDSFERKPIGSDESVSWEVQIMLYASIFLLAGQSGEAALINRSPANLCQKSGRRGDCWSRRIHIFWRGSKIAGCTRTCAAWRRFVASSFQSAVSFSLFLFRCFLFSFPLFLLCHGLSTSTGSIVERCENRNLLEQYCLA
jgi:hypothetical protein